MPEKTPPPQVTVKRDLKPRTFLVIAAMAALGALLVLLGAYDIRGFAGTSSAYVIGYPFSFLVHFLLGAMIVGGVMELRRPSDLLGALGRTGMTVLTLAFAGLVVWADLKVHAVAEVGGHGGSYIVVVVVGLICGAVPSYLILSPKRLQKNRRQFFAVQGVSAIGGFIGGALSVVICIAALGFIRFHTLPDSEIGTTAVHNVPGQYVALGDSYSAGEGIRPFNPNTGSVDSFDGDDCHRSSQAYSQWLIFDSPARPTRFVACSGAVTPDAYTAYERTRSDGSKLTVDAQVDEGPHPDVGLVTITMGGNDILFSKIVVHCLEHDECMSDTFTPPDEKPPPDEETRSDVDDQAAAATVGKIPFPEPKALRDWGAEAIGMVSTRVEDLYADLKVSYSNARIVVIGYPQLFPDREAPWIPDDCASLLRRFSSAERSELREMTTKFNNVLYERAVEAEIEFVSPAAMWDGHEPCGSKGQYTNSVKLIFAPGVVDGGSFHPSRKGQQALASLVACYVNTHPDPPNPYVGGTPKDFTVEGLQSPRQLGLVDAPGSVEAPLSCAGTT